jgi:hypothetical protein
MTARVLLKKLQIVILKGLGTKMNRLAVNRQSQGNFDFNFDSSVSAVQ